jgi:hypothetical protein
MKNFDWRETGGHQPESGPGKKKKKNKQQQKINKKNKNFAHTASFARPNQNSVVGNSFHLNILFSSPHQNPEKLRS